MTLSEKIVEKVLQLKRLQAHHCSQMFDLRPNSTLSPLTKKIKDGSSKRRHQPTASTADKATEGSRKDEKIKKEDCTEEKAHGEKCWSSRKNENV